MNINSIVQQLQAQQQARSSGVTANAATANTSASSTSDDSNTTITADDFITLLVTELQNQDPTADTDPNSYVNQLINVNSLQQLISINQGVTELGSIGSTSMDVLAAIDENVSALDPSSTSGSAGSSTSGSAGSSTSDSAMAHAVSSAQMASAQVGYGAFASDSSNPVASINHSSSTPVVPSEWRTKTNALP